jgi:hypothetical protein
MFNHFTFRNLLAAMAALGLAGCKSPDMTGEGNMQAFIYDGGRVERRVFLTAEEGARTPELQKWIRFNNETLYRFTLTLYVPRIVVNFPSQNEGYTFYSNTVQRDSHVRDMEAEDHEFINWLKSQPGMPGLFP